MTKNFKPRSLPTKHVITSLLALFFLSCEINYDGDERLLVTGTLINKNNQPLSDLNIEFWIHKGSGIGSDSDLINHTSTDNEGQFLMLIPSPNNEDEFELKISDLNTNYQSKYLSRILDINFKHYQYNTGKIILYKQDSITNAYIAFQKTSTNTSLIAVNFKGDADFSVYINEPELNYGDYEPTIRHNYYKNVPLNSVLTITYTVRDNSTETLSTHEKTISIENENLEHVINY